MTDLDIFNFWAEVGPEDHVHPADAPIFDRVRYAFDLRCLPTCFYGPLRSAPVVLLYLSPGWSKGDLVEAATKAGQEAHIRIRAGYEPLHDSTWIRSRTKEFGNWEQVRHKVAVLNIGAYHSPRFTDHGLLAALPSSRMSLDWAQHVLFAQAVEGRRVAVCMRAARFWGLTEGRRYGEGLFAPLVVRGGHMRRGEMRDEIVRAVQAKLAASP